MRPSLTGFLTLLCLCLVGQGQGASAQDCETGTFEGAFDGEVIVPQNWNCSDRQEFWFTDQGSQIVPYVWFLHLEQAGSSVKFSDPANMDRYGYLPQAPTTLNPDGLPIGFTKGDAKSNDRYGEISKDWLGMTCAACHTGQVEFEGVKYLIDGAPTMGDFEGLFQGLVAAMKATLDDKAKFARFAEVVIADSRARGSDGTSDRTELRNQLREIADIRDAWNARNSGTSPYGHARLDAIGAIFNEVGATGLGVPGNASPANAPVSYPFIWDAPQHDRVQWNGSIENANIGALGRNVGEVLGVFGSLSLNTHRLSRSGHATSINIASLGRLEGLLWELQSPLWSDTSLPPIRQKLVERGRGLFETYCKKCHQDIDRADPNRRVTAMMWPAVNPQDPDDDTVVGTDPTMAVNFLTRTAKAERLTGRFTRYWGFFSDWERFERAQQDQTPQVQILGYAVIGSITRKLYTDPKETLRAIRVGQPPAVLAILDRAKRHLEAEPGKAGIRKFLVEVLLGLNALQEEANGTPCSPAGPLPCYKARPLNGIWATAPYLHNGSVRTLRQLLLPAEKRDAKFRVGSREFDPEAIGFVDDGAFVLDTSLPGNSNAGHEGQRYGNEALANDKEKLDALLEYLKTL